MRHIAIGFCYYLILCLAGCTSFIFLTPASVLGAGTESPVDAAPKVDHILLEVSNLDASIAFYRDILGLRLKSRTRDFVMLESDNVGLFLWSARWDWEKPSSNFERQGVRTYPHLSAGVAATVLVIAPQAGYRITHQPRKY